MKKMVLIILVFTIMFSGCNGNQTTEKKPNCTPTEMHNIISIEKCTINGITVFKKTEDSTMITDVAGTIYFDENEEIILQDYYFSEASCSRNGEEECSKKLKEWNPKFEVEKCEWKKVCSYPEK